MDMKKMKKDLGGGAVFELGEENVAFAKYFTGECYLTAFFKSGRNLEVQGGK